MTRTELDEIARLAPSTLPEDYGRFLLEYGLPQWGFDMPDTFDYTMSGGGGQVVRNHSITHLQNILGLTGLRKYG